MLPSDASISPLSALTCEDTLLAKLDMTGMVVALKG